MGARSPAEERGFGLAEILLWEVRLALQDRCDAHFTKMRFAQRRGRIGLCLLQRHVEPIILFEQFDREFAVASTSRRLYVTYDSVTNPWRSAAIFPRSTPNAVQADLEYGRDQSKQTPNAGDRGNAHGIRTSSGSPVREPGRNPVHVIGFQRSSKSDERPFTVDCLIAIRGRCLSICHWPFASWYSHSPSEKPPAKRPRDLPT